MRDGVEVSSLKETGHGLKRRVSQAFSCRYNKTGQYGRRFGSDWNQAPLDYKYTVVMVMQLYYYRNVKRILERLQNHPVWGTAKLWPSYAKTILGFADNNW